MKIHEAIEHIKESNQAMYASRTEERIGGPYIEVYYLSMFDNEEPPYLWLQYTAGHPGDDMGVDDGGYIEEYPECMDLDWKHPLGAYEPDRTIDNTLAILSGANFWDMENDEA